MNESCDMKHDMSFYDLGSVRYSNFLKLHEYNVYNTTDNIHFLCMCGGGFAVFIQYFCPVSYTLYSTIVDIIPCIMTSIL